jgi:23S rRNA pseudouridine1911/1915/1917 synthase
MTSIQHKVTEEEVGSRVDQLVSNLTGVSRSQVQNAIDSGRLTLNSKPLKKNGKKVQLDDYIKGDISVPSSDLAPEDIPLDIIAETDDLIVINKDAGIVVHPDESGHSSGTLVNALLAHSQSLSDGSGEERPGIVHRLDKDTSGVLIVAKNNKTHEKLAKAFHDREVEKIYLALVVGVPKTSKGTINAAIRRSSKERIKMAIHNQGKSAVTHFEVEAVYKGATLLKVSIETGRTHQIRVHLASIGHPVIGDKVYGDNDYNEEFKKNFGLRHQFLHANTLSIDGNKYVAPLKPDLLEVLEQLSKT